MAITPDSVKHLRQGGWLQWTRPDGHLFLHRWDLGLQWPQQGRPAVVVAEAGLLQSYVAELSDVMWDVLEHTEKELWLLVPGGRNVLEGMLQPDGAVWLHWAKQGPLHALAHPMGRPLFALWVPQGTNITPVLEGLENVVTLPPQKAADRRAMRMAPNGSIQMME